MDLYDFSYKTTHAGRSHRIFVRFFVQLAHSGRTRLLFVRSFVQLIALWPHVPWFCTTFRTKQRTQADRTVFLYDSSYNSRTLVARAFFLYDLSYNSSHSGRTRLLFVRCIVQNNAYRRPAPWFCTMFRTKQRTQADRTVFLYDLSYNSSHSGRTCHGFVRFFVQNNARRPIAPYFCTILRTTRALWPHAPSFCTIFRTTHRTLAARAMVLYDFSYKTTHAGRSHRIFVRFFRSIPRAQSQNTTVRANHRTPRLGSRPPSRRPRPVTDARTSHARLVPSICRRPSAALVAAAITAATPPAGCG